MVIGGGIAGPVTALALRRAGIEATVHEAYETPADGLRGWLQVAPNGLEALRIIGAAGAVETSGRPIRVIGDGRGRKFGAYDGVPGLPPGHVLRRPELYRLLHDHAAAQGVRVERGRRLTGVEETGDGVTARFGDGSAATAEVLVGADGIRSTVRTLVDPGRRRPGVRRADRVRRPGGGAEVTPQMLVGQAVKELVLPLPQVRTAPPRGRPGLIGIRQWFWLDGAGQWTVKSKRVQVGNVWAEVTASPRRLVVSPGAGLPMWCVTARARRTTRGARRRSRKAAAPICMSGRRPVSRVTPPGCR
ncbi:FAD-dependent monooxygenase [Microbispora sp. ZYX-F-249]|uniref:FAD-dependent monooxygenase n=1 Tax=Microbispora maris TaxID=3144104 RepID=A0ABV0AZ02_9ACTN